MAAILLPFSAAAGRPRSQIPTMSSPSPSPVSRLSVPILRQRISGHCRRLRAPNAAVLPAHSQGSFDPELRFVLDLATDDELRELEHILFGPSYFSPLLKSIAKRQESDYMAEGEFIEEREDFIVHLESRFLYLAADARSVLRGWRPSYRNVLLCVRRKLGVPCSRKLSTEDLEVEIFLHLINEYSSQENGILSLVLGDFDLSSNSGSLEVGLSKWKNAIGALKVGAKGLQEIALKGCGMLSVAKVYQLLAGRLSGKVLLEAAKYEIKHEMIKRGGQLAAISVERKAAELVAKRGLAHAASRYLGLRSAMMMLGPVMWGTFLADVVIQMLGTDYARIVRAIYAFAQIRLTRTHIGSSTRK